MSMQNGTPPSTDRLFWESMGWTVVAGIADYAILQLLVRLASGVIPNPSLSALPLWQQAVAWVAIGVLALVNLAIVFSAGEWLAARRRGMERQGFRNLWDSARREKDRKRARRGVRSALSRLQEADDTEFFEVEIAEGDTKTEVRITEL